MPMHRQFPSLGQLYTPGRVDKTVHIDLVGTLMEADGFKYTLTSIDLATHYPIAVPLKSTEATEVWRRFEDNWIGTFGVPTSLISDRGAQITSNYWAEQ